MATNTTSNRRRWTIAVTAAALAVAPAGAARADLSSPRPVLATANIFGAGYGDTPGEAGGGGGTLAPGWRLPTGSQRIVTFPAVTGTVTPIVGSAPYNGPAGDGPKGLGGTDIDSWRGISGIVDAKNGMFLVGVFLGDAEPALAAPPRLDFTDRERFDSLAPLIGQTFLIGDGSGRRYEVPADATRLYVGFADGNFYKGKPGYYGNNAGRLEVVASGVLDSLDTTAPELSGARNKAVTVPRRRKRVRVGFKVEAMDGVDGALPVSCAPASGGFFALGRTTVRCSATDTSGNAAQAEFIVTVSPRRRR